MSLFTVVLESGGCCEAWTDGDVETIFEAWICKRTLEEKLAGCNGTLLLDWNHTWNSNLDEEYCHEIRIRLHDE